MKTNSNGLIGNIWCEPDACCFQLEMKDSHTCILSGKLVIRQNKAEAPIGNGKAPFRDGRKGAHWSASHLSFVVATTGRMRNLKLNATSTAGGKLTSLRSVGY